MKETRPYLPWQLAEDFLIAAFVAAGVPKEDGAKCLNDDINNFHQGFIFDGRITGKKTHVYFHKDIYIDKYGNETADSISLIPCDYELDSVNVVNWEELFNEEIQIQIYEE